MAGRLTVKSGSSRYTLGLNSTERGADRKYLKSVLFVQINPRRNT